MSKTVKIVAIVLSVAIVGVAGYFGYTKWNTMKEDMDAQVVAKDTEIAELQEELDLANEKLDAIQEVVSPTETKEDKTPVAKSNVGYVKFNPKYTIGDRPAYRICFSDYEDISKQYCF